MYRTGNEIGVLGYTIVLALGSTACPNHVGSVNDMFECSAWQVGWYTFWCGMPSWDSCAMVTAVHCLLRHDRFAGRCR